MSLYVTINDVDCTTYYHENAKFCNSYYDSVRCRVNA